MPDNDAVATFAVGYVWRIGADLHDIEHVIAYADDCSFGCGQNIHACSLVCKGWQCKISSGLRIIGQRSAGEIIVA